MKMWIRILSHSLSVTFLLFAQSISASPYPQQVTDLLTGAKSQVQTISMDVFKSILDQGKYDLILDVREPDEFAQGHIPKSINLPRGVVEFKIWPLVGYPEHTRLDLRIYVYCGTGSRCILATQSLQGLGFSRAIAVDMKIEDWIKAGYPITGEEFKF